MAELQQEMSCGQFWAAAPATLGMKPRFRAHIHVFGDGRSRTTCVRIAYGGVEPLGNTVKSCTARTQVVR